MDPDHVKGPRLGLKFDRKPVTDLHFLVVRVVQPRPRWQGGSSSRSEFRPTNVLEIEDRGGSRISPAVAAESPAIY